MALLLDTCDSEESERSSQDVEALLQRQKDRHREEMRSIVALCNQELRKRDASFASLLEGDHKRAIGLPSNLQPGSYLRMIV